MFQPCPFCASADIREKSFCAKNNEPHHAVTCAQCGVHTPYYATPAEAAGAWNRRAAWLPGATLAGKVSYRPLTDAQILAIGAFGQSPLTRLAHARAVESAILANAAVPEA